MYEDDDDDAGSASFWELGRARSEGPWWGPRFVTAVGSNPFRKTSSYKIVKIPGHFRFFEAVYILRNPRHTYRVGRASLARARQLPRARRASISYVCTY